MDLSGPEWTGQDVEAGHRGCSRWQIQNRPFLANHQCLGLRGAPGAQQIVDAASFFTPSRTLQPISARCVESHPQGARVDFADKAALLSNGAPPPPAQRPVRRHRPEPERWPARHQAFQIASDHKRAADSLIQVFVDGQDAAHRLLHRCHPCPAQPIQHREDCIIARKRAVSIKFLPRSSRKLQNDPFPNFSLIAGRPTDTVSLKNALGQLQRRTCQ